MQVAAPVLLRRLPLLPLQLLQLLLFLLLLPNRGAGRTDMLVGGTRALPDDARVVPCQSEEASVGDLHDVGSHRVGAPRR